MKSKQQELIETTLDQLFKESENDKVKMMEIDIKSKLQPIEPSDYKDVYISISKEQGEDLVMLIKNNKLKRMVEFGTSFGISTLYLARGARETDGTIITTELIGSKANKAIENFKRAGVNDLIEVRTGDALVTLKDHSEPIDLLLLDGWKNLYLPLFEMLEPNFHSNTIIYVDNADMDDTQQFLKFVSQNSKYQIEIKFKGKAALITIKH